MESAGLVPELGPSIEIVGQAVDHGADGADSHAEEDAVAAVEASNGDAESDAEEDALHE
jgi:hypothetical protein